MNRCGNCMYYRIKSGKCRGMKGYCTRNRLKISARGYLEDGMFRYAEVPNNGLCDSFRRNECDGWRRKNDNG